MQYLSVYQDWLQLVNDITEGLKHIHNHELVYRDLKADNIALYQQESCRIHAVIVDFGKCLPASSCTNYSLSVSQRQLYRESHRHISPDLVDRVAKPSKASNIYSLGRIMKQTVC